MTDTEGRHLDDQTQDAHVAALLAAAAAPVEPGPLQGEEAALAAFGAVHHQPGRHHVRSSLVSFKAGLAAAVGAGVLLTGGAAAAATGSLPGAAQQTAHDVLANIGVTVPGPNAHAQGHPGQRGASGDHTPTASDATPGSTTQTDQQTGSSAASDSQGKGSMISPLAKSKDTTGLQKGVTVSTAASGGKSQAGDHGKAAAHQAGAHGQAGADHSQASAHQPTGDHTATGKQHQPQVTPQGGDASTTGQGTAAAASAGRSTKGTTTGSNASGSPRP